MSFAKAKLQRFNDIKDCSPSPAKYNVAAKNKIKCSLFTVTERFTKRGSPPPSEAGSVQSTPCFQTPTVPKKKKILSLSSTKKTKSVDFEELKEKIVECNNKDIYIRELVEQLEEMKVKVCDLQQQRAVAEQEKAVIECEKEQLKQDTILKSEHEQALKDLDSKFTNDIEQINARMSEELAECRKQCEELKKENQEEMKKLLANLDKFQTLYNQTVEESKSLLEEKDNEILKKEIEMKEKYILEIDELQDHYEIEREQASNKIKALENEKEAEVSKYKTLLSEYEAKIKLLEEDFKDVNLLAEIQTKEKVTEVENNWKLKLEQQEKQAEAILKECQEISEYNIIECELEKNQLKGLLSEKESLLEDLRKEHAEIAGKYTTLEENYSKLEAELNEARETLASEKRVYEITINTSQVTIEVLKKRLINSDRDVEQLKEELADTEAKLLNYEKRCGELQNQLQESQTAHEELEMQCESTIKITESEVKDVENRLIKQVTQFTENQKKQNEQAAKLFAEVYAQLHEQQELNSKAQIVIDESRAMVECLEVDNNKLKCCNGELREKIESYKIKMEDYKAEIEEAAEIRKKYIEKSGKYDELSQKYDQLLRDFDSFKREKSGKYEELAQKHEQLQQAFSSVTEEKGQLERKISAQDVLIEPLEKQVETYETELQLLKTHIAKIEEENHSLAEKYADILGHQNLKQKLKYLKALQMKNSELLQNNIDLDNENYKLTKLVDKLRREVAELKKSTKRIKTHGDDKENVNSPGRPLGRVESPGPLKEKN